MPNALKYSLLLCLSLTTGCTGWKFYEVESKYKVEPASTSNRPDTTMSESYSTMIPTVRTIALSAPAVCTSETHSQASGVNTHQDTLLQSRCGQEMSYIERALIDQGFRVISWSVVDDGANKGSNTALQVAKTLGADLLLSINSLERTQNIGSVTEWQRYYYLSDKHGARGNPIERADHSRMSEAVGNVELYERNYWTQGSHPSVNLSATATSTKLGEAVWFYNSTLSQSRSGSTDGSYSTKWACDRTGDCKRWGSPTERKKLKKDPDAYSISHQAPSQFKDREVHDALIKEAVKDMAESMKYGR